MISKLVLAFCISIIGGVAMLEANEDCSDFLIDSHLFRTSFCSPHHNRDELRSHEIVEVRIDKCCKNKTCEDICHSSPQRSTGREHVCGLMTYGCDGYFVEIGSFKINMTSVKCCRKSQSWRQHVYNIQYFYTIPFKHYCPYIVIQNNVKNLGIQ